MNGKVRVGINGYGVIGKRVADAVALQSDMEISGVTAVNADYRVRIAAERGYPIYCVTPDRRQMMTEAHIPTLGSLEDLVMALPGARQEIIPGANHAYPWVRYHDYNRLLEEWFAT